MKQRVIYLRHLKNLTSMSFRGAERRGISLFYSKIKTRFFASLRMTIDNQFFRCLYFLIFISTFALAQDAKIDFRSVDIKYLNESQFKEYIRWRDEQFRMLKAAGYQSEIKSLIIQGNKIRTLIYNSGAISQPGERINNLVWNGLGYGYEFGPLVGSRVPKAVDQEFDNSDNIIFPDTLKLGLVNNVVSNSIKPGDTITFKIVLKNNDGNSLTNVVIKDTIRFPLTLISQSSNLGNVTNVDSIITYSNSTLASGASDTITVRARIQPSVLLNRQIHNKAFANYNNSRFNSSSFTIRTNNNSALSANSNIASASFNFGDTVRYVVTVSNISKVLPLLNISITDTIRFPMKLVGRSVTTGTLTSKDSILSYVNPQLLPGSSVAITILARIESNMITKQNLIHRIFAIAERFSQDSVNIVIDGFGAANRSTADGDFAPDGVTKWGWLPKQGYSATGQNDLASWGARTSDLRIKPKSWPESWYNSVLGEYVYPSFLGGNATVPDEEVYYIVDDSTDAEFEYYPFIHSRARRGLGLNLEVRTFQFSNPLAEDIIFLVYTAENDPKSKLLPRVFFGMFGDPHVGGFNNFDDDAASFIPARAIGIPNYDKLLTVDGKLTSQLSRNLVYVWDPDGRSDNPNIPPGYFGYKFLESPSNNSDGIDNDDDGIIDESPYNDKGTFIDGINVPLMTGINDSVKYIALYGVPKSRWSGDEDGDWNKDNDDLGVDGIFGTSDFGEGNGVPDQLIGADGSWLGSEPNFGFRDVNESDQIGRTSFISEPFGANNRPKNDNLMYGFISSTNDTAGLFNLYTTDPTKIGDYIFLYGSGPFAMRPGHRERFSIALLMGIDLKDLLLNSETAQLVLQANYRFAQPPPKPKVTAVAGNGRVTLYWDNAAENASDPFSGKKDFEGYKIYRSRDYTFKDVFSITDGNGYPFLGKALYDDKARKSAQWHRPWTQAEQDKYLGGFMPVEYRGRYIKYYMGEPGDNTGLRHEYVDSTVTNGITYYYAVVSFDHGDDSLQLPPSESQSIIQRDPVTQEFKFDINTVAVVPNAEAKGLVSTKSDLEKGIALSHTKGVGTGSIQFKVLNELALNNSLYRISFARTKVGKDTIVAYSILKRTPTVEQFIGNENLFVNLQNKNFVAASVNIYDGADTTALLVSSASILVDSVNGRLRATTTGILLRTKTYTVSYQYYPVANSGYYKANDSNPVFDGIRAYALNDTLLLDAVNTGFTSKINSDSMVANISTTFASITTGKIHPIDYRITFTTTTTALDSSGNYIAPADSFVSSATVISVNKVYVKTPFKIENITDTTKLTIIIQDKTGPNNKAGRWDLGEEIIFMELAAPISQSKIFHNLLITRKSGVINYVIPAGSVYNLITKKPFAVNDEYEFSTKAMTYNATLGDQMLQNVYVVPNPYVINSAFEIPSNRTDLRGDRAIQFRNLPRECTIRIYTITGELVQTLRKNDNTAYLNWDLLSSESARIGYGVYIYHIETPTGGIKIGRLGIIK